MISRQRRKNKSAPFASLPGTPNPAPALPFRDRALLWMNRYLAFNVQPRQRRAAPAEFPETPRRTARAGSTERPRDQERPHATTAQWRTPALRARTIPRFAAGDRIADAYEVREVVGAGDLNTVYVAHHPHWNIDLIVKVPNAQLLMVPAALRQLAARAERWAAISAHPNIASCYHIHWMDGVPVPMIERVDGGNLRLRIDEQRGVNLRTNLDVAIEMCHGLEHAHKRGVVHGSLQPGNVLFTLQGTVKLTDFGVHAHGAPHAPRGGASDAGDPVARWFLLRVADYVAPERWLHPTTADVHADIFALGVCLYEMFCGRRPYLSTAASRQDAPLPEAGGDPLPETLASVMQRCVDWRRERRPDNVEHIRQQLSSLYEELFGGPSGRVTDQSRAADESNDKAVSYFYLGNYAEAEAAWGAALTADAAHLDTLFNRGLAQWRRGLLTDEAVVQQLDRVWVARSERWKARYLQALIHLERGDAESAVALLEQALRDRPGTEEVETALQRIATAPGAPPAAGAFGEHAEYVSSVGISADGSIVVSGSYDRTATVWDAHSGERLRIFEGHDGPVSCVWLSADGRRALTGSDDRTMRLWDVESGQCERIFDGDVGRVSCLSLSEDGQLLLWAGMHSSQDIERITLQLWDVKSGRRLRTFEGHASAVKSAQLSADGRWAISGSDDQTVRVWNVGSGECERVLTGHQHFVSAVCFSADAQLILSGSWDQTLRLWDARSGKCVRSFAGHSALVSSVSLSADNRWALSGGWDCAVRLWDVGSGRCLRTFRGHASLVSAVALAPDGRSAVSGSWDNTLRRWHVPAPGADVCTLRLSRLSA